MDVTYSLQLLYRHSVCNCILFNSLYECNDHKQMSHTLKFENTNIAFNTFFISDMLSLGIHYIVNIPIINSTSYTFNIFVCVIYIVSIFYIS